MAAAVRRTEALRWIWTWAARTIWIAMRPLPAARSSGRRPNSAPPPSCARRCSSSRSIRAPWWIPPSRLACGHPPPRPWCSPTSAAPCPLHGAVVVAAAASWHRSANQVGGTGMVCHTLAQQLGPHGSRVPTPTPREAVTCGSLFLGGGQAGTVTCERIHSNGERRLASESVVTATGRESATSTAPSHRGMNPWRTLRKFAVLQWRRTDPCPRHHLFLGLQVSWTSDPHLYYLFFSSLLVVLMQLRCMTDKSMRRLHDGQLLWFFCSYSRLDIKSYSFELQSTSRLHGEQLLCFSFCSYSRLDIKSVQLWAPISCLFWNFNAPCLHCRSLESMMCYVFGMMCMWSIYRQFLESN